MQVIYKYQLNAIKGINELNLPKGARTLKVDFQNYKLMLWCLVDTEQILERRVFFAAVTGLDLELDVDKLRYVGTCQDMYVAHVFEVLKENKSWDYLIM